MRERLLERDTPARSCDTASLSSIGRAIALGIAAAAAYNPTSDAAYVRVYGGKYLVDRP